MSSEVISKVEKKYMVARPELHIGDTVVVDTVIRDGDKKRIQKFKGIVIAMKGKGLSKTFTVRKISYGVGVEKIFPLYSPNVESIEITAHANVRRSKLYFLRDRVGKAATKLKPGKALTDDSNALIEIEEDDPIVAETQEDAVEAVEEASTENETQEKVDETPEDTK